MKKERTTVKQKSETKLTETLSLEVIKEMYPYSWKKIIKELEVSRFKSVVFPE